MCPSLVIVHTKICAHKPLPFGDSFYANVIMKFTKEYDNAEKKLYTQGSIGTNLVFVKDVFGFKSLVTNFFERATVENFNFYMIPAMD